MMHSLLCSSYQREIIKLIRESTTLLRLALLLLQAKQIQVIDGKNYIVITKIYEIFQSIVPRDALNL